MEDIYRVALEKVFMCRLDDDVIHHDWEAVMRRFSKYETLIKTNECDATPFGVLPRKYKMLCIMCVSKDIELIKLYLKAPYINIVEAKHYPFNEAVRKGDVEFARFMLGISGIDISGGPDENLLMIDGDSDNVEMARFLIEDCKYDYKQDEYIATVAAAKDNNMNTLEYLLSLGSHPDYVVSTILETLIYYCNNDVLTETIKRSAPPAIVSIIDSILMKNKTSSDGNCGLFTKLCTKHKVLAKMFSRTIFYFTCVSGNHKLMEYAYKLNKNIQIDSYNYISAVCLSGSVKAVKFFIKKGVSLNTAQIDPIVPALRSGSIDLINFLTIKCKLTIDDECLLLPNAVLSGNAEMVKYAYKNSVSNYDSIWIESLCVAIVSEYLEVIKYLFTIIPRDELAKETNKIIYSTTICEDQEIVKYVLDVYVNDISSDLIKESFGEP